MGSIRWHGAGGILAVALLVSGVSAAPAESQLPLAFEPNRGQAAQGVEWIGRARGALVLVERGGLTLVARPGGSAIRMRFAGGAASTDVSPWEELPGKVHHLRGRDPARWITDLPTYARLTQTDVFPGIDAVYHGCEGRLEYDLVVRPGADAGVISLRFEGAVPALGADGVLRLALPDGEMRMDPPKVFQDTADGRAAVPGRFTLAASGAVGFEVGEHDGAVPLVIDPVLTYSSYVGTTGTDLVTDIAVNEAGDIFVCGRTTSTSFPVTTGAVQTQKGDSSGSSTDGFVMKFDPTMSSVRFATYLGGSGDDSCQDVAPGPEFGVLVSGDTASTDFPTAAAHTPVKPAGTAAFVARLNSNGNSLVFSTFSASGENRGLDSDAGGAAYHLLRDGDAAVVRKYAVDGSTIAYQTSVGDGESAYPEAIAVDGLGRASVVGTTGSSGFPATSGVVQTTFGGGGSTRGDGFAFQLDLDGDLAWSTFLGGSGDDVAHDVAVDGLGNVHVVGETLSSNYPLSRAAQATSGGGTDGFVTVLNSSGTVRVFSTYLGGSANDLCRGVTADDCGNVFVTGETDSTGFPATGGAPQTSLSAGVDAFVARYESDGDLDWASFHGGTSDDVGERIALGDGGLALVVGTTGSSNFPTSSGAYRAVQPGGTDGFTSAFRTDPSSFEIITDSLPPWTVGQAFSRQLTSTGGGAPLTWSVVSGSPPTGLSLGSDGMLTGIPDIQGAFTFRAKLTDRCGLFTVRTLSMVVNTRPAFASAGLPAWTVGFAYPQTFSVLGGTPQLTFDLLDGTIPAGLTFSPLGRLTGTVMEVGSSTFTVEVTDANGATATKQYTVVVNALPQISTAAARDCTTGMQYVEDLANTGGTGPFSWTLTSGSLPASTTIVPATGLISGTAKAPGTYTFTVQLTDAIGAVTTKDFETVVNPLPEFVTTAVPIAARARPFVFELQSRLGTPPHTFDVTGFGDQLPAGVTLTQSTGALGGIPSAPGTYDVIFLVTDACGAETQATLRMVVAEIFLLTNRTTFQDLEFGNGLPQQRLHFLDLLGGTKLSVSAKKLGKGDADFTLELLDASGIPVDVGKRFSARGKSAAIKKFEIAATDRYFMSVRANAPFEGTIRFDMKAVAATSFSGEGDVAAVQMPLVVRVPALPEAIVTTKAVRGKRSTAAPQIQSFTDGGPGGSVLEPALVKLGSKSVVYKHPDPVSGGELSVTFVSRPGTSGLIKWSVKVKQPKTYDFGLVDLPSGFIPAPPSAK